MKLIIDIPEEMHKQIMDGYVPLGISKYLKNGIPLEDIKAEIEKVFCISVITDKLRTPMEVKTEILQIIDKYKAESEIRE